MGPVGWICEHLPSEAVLWTRVMIEKGESGWRICRTLSVSALLAW